MHRHLTIVWDTRDAGPETWEAAEEALIDDAIRALSMGGDDTQWVDSHSRPADEVEAEAEELEGLRAAVALHQERRLDGDGYTSIWCCECRQNWPCPTVQAVRGEA